jgi:hypothetical protein
LYVFAALARICVSFDASILLLCLQKKMSAGAGYRAPDRKMACSDARVKIVKIDRPALVALKAQHVISQYGQQRSNRKQL